MVDAVLSRNPGAPAGPASEGSEADLVRAAQRGDHVAFSELVKRYQDTVYAVAYALTGRFNVSEDVAQETFVLAWRRRKELRDPERFRAWLMTVARRAALRALRYQRSRGGDSGFSAVAEDFPSPDPSPLDRAISREEERFLWNALRRIPETYRIPLILLYGERSSIQEVARALGLSETTARQRLSRGRRMLQQHVTGLLESVLSRARLGKAFTATTVAAIVAIEASPASAALPWYKTGSAAMKIAAGATLALTLAAGLFLGVGRWRDQGASGAGRGKVPAQVDEVVGARSPAPPAFRLAGVTTEVARDRAPVAPNSASAVERIRSVVSFDFEDGVLPDIFRLGHVVPGPDRPGSQNAVLATLHPWGETYMVGVSMTPENISYRDTLVFTFDYWLGNDADNYVTVDIYNKDKLSVYSRPVKRVVHERWGSASVRVSSLTPNYDRPPMEPGDWLYSFSVYGGKVGGKPFYVDNLRISDAAP